MIRNTNAIAAVIALFICVASNIAASQAKYNGTSKKPIPNPNLSGKWVLDKKRSDPGAGLRVDLADVTLLIDHKEPNISIRREVRRNGMTTVEQSVYTTTQQQPKSKPEEEQVTKAVTEWKGSRLVTTILAIVQADPRKKPTLVMEMVEEWDLSKDGKTLTQRLRRNGVPGTGALKARFVFSRAS
jgi:hypothetical protein